MLSLLPGITIINSHTTTILIKVSYYYNSYYFFLKTIFISFWLGYIHAGSLSSLSRGSNAYSLQVITLDLRIPCYPYFIYFFNLFCIRKQMASQDRSGEIRRLGFEPLNKKRSRVCAHEFVKF